MTNTHLITHVAFVIDESYSMKDHADSVVNVVDAQVAHLAKQSQQQDHEVRVSVYTFADDVRCIIFDRDVLRLPSLKGLYQPSGWTALRDAVMLSQADLRKTATMYGDHAFLTFVVTDGHENRSKIWREQQLRDHLKTLRENETIGLLVPDWLSKQHAEGLGFHRGNIAVWDAGSAQGMEEAMDTMRQATDSYLSARSMGVKSSTGIFTMDPNAVNHKTVKQLTELSGFRVAKVKDPAVIRPFIEDVLKLPFIQGNYFFLLAKREKIGPQKEVIIRHKISGKLYGGKEARTVLNLPDHEVSVKPEPNSEYDVFVQSTSLNRNLLPGHELLIRM